MLSHVKKDMIMCLICGEITLQCSVYSGEYECLKCLERAQSEENKKHALKLKADKYSDFKDNIIKQSGASEIHLICVSHLDISDYIANLTSNIEQGIGLTFYGPPGTGKTTMAVRIVIEAYRKGFTTGYLKATSKDRLNHTYLNSQLLIIEDLHRAVKAYANGKFNQNDQNEIYELVEHRRNNFLTTIYISNFGRTKFDKDGNIVAMGIDMYLGADVYDRITDRNRQIVIKFEGKSYRQIKDIKEE